MKKTITLTIAGTDFGFTVSTSDYNDYINALMPDNKVAPNHNLAVRTVHSDQKQDLSALLGENPGAAVNIGALIAREFAPQLEISVKK